MLEEIPAPRPELSKWAPRAISMVIDPDKIRIVIGKGGEMLKQIATKARKDLEQMIGMQVFLTLYVRVKDEWRDNDYIMKELGYDLKSLKKD